MNKIEELVTRYYAAFNARDFESYGKLFTPTCRIEAPGFSAQGLEAMRAFDHGWIGAFPEVRIETLRTHVVGALLGAANWIHGGPQKGPLHGPGGTIPATGKLFSAPYCATFVIEGDRIAKQKLAFDAEAIPALLGLTG